MLQEQDTKITSPTEALCNSQALLSSYEAAVKLHWGHHVHAGYRGVLQERDAKITSLVEALGNSQALLNFSTAT